MYLYIALKLSWLSLSFWVKIKRPTVRDKIDNNKWFLITFPSTGRRNCR